MRTKFKTSANLNRVRGEFESNAGQSDLIKIRAINRARVRAARVCVSRAAAN